jgi:hypothetical protein
MVAMHLVWGALTGPSVIGSGCRLAPGEDPDALARDVLELVIAGLKTGSRTTFIPCALQVGATPTSPHVAATHASPGVDHDA